eukprot:scaffold150031_cov30-Tisochrysis_lutea.AAC.1
MLRRIRSSLRMDIVDGFKPDRLVPWDPADSSWAFRGQRGVAAGSGGLSLRGTGETTPGASRCANFIAQIVAARVRERLVTRCGRSGARQAE